MWQYKVASGDLFQNNQFVATGYSGEDDALNNPNDENVANYGPIPAGYYTIGAPFTHPVCGPYSLRLTPDNTNHMFGRYGFLIHGDSILMNHTASQGCIILARPIREKIVASGDIRLEVINP